MKKFPDLIEIFSFSYMVVGMYIVSGIPLSETHSIELSTRQTITKRLSE